MLDSATNIIVKNAHGFGNHITYQKRRNNR